MRSRKIANLYSFVNSPFLPSHDGKMYGTDTEILFILLFIMEKITLRLHIYGRVQGVFFRESMRTKAHELGITGWVRNRFDGSVEAVVQGTPENIQIMAEWAKAGPPAAQVERVEVSDEKGEFHSFDRLPSA